MLLILCNWIFIFISSLVFGFLLKKLLKIDNQNFIIHHVLGLFSISIFSWIYAVFFALDIFFNGIQFCVIIVGWFLFRGEVKAHFKELKRLWFSFKKSYKIGFIFVFIASLAMSASVPSIFDNESYYLQTIKWLNEYGLVKGLGNLHIFFGQTSSWHILQASFTFPFLETNFNDLNGYFLVVFSLFCFQKLQDYSSSKKLNDLYIGSTLISLPFFIFFINAPSPDLPVFLLGQLLFYLFIKFYKEIDCSMFTIIVVLTLFLCVIKITTCILVLLPLILLIKHYKTLKYKLVKPILISLLIAVLFIGKNVILTGYLLYPLENFDALNVDWKVPIEMVALFKTGTYSAAFDYQELEYMSNLQLLIAWLTSFKFNGIINTIFTFLLIVFPFLWYFKSEKKPIFIIYLLAVFHFVLAWNFSPQYRFFFFFMLFFFLQMIIWFLRKERRIVLFIYFSFLCSLVPFFTELKLSSYTTIKKTNTKTSILKFENILETKFIRFAMILQIGKIFEAFFSIV